jgi:hypothetical protein
MGLKYFKIVPMRKLNPVSADLQYLILHFGIYYTKIWR